MHHDWHSAAYVADWIVHDTARDPERHAILLDFTILSSVLHGAVMTYDSFAQEHEMTHLVGDVPILFALAGLMLWLHPRWTENPSASA